MDDEGDPAGYLAVALAAREAGVPERTVRHWVKRGKLPAKDGNRGHLVRLADVRRIADLAGIERPPAAPLPATPQPADLAADLAESGRHETRALAVVPEDLGALLAVVEDAYRGQLAAKDDLIAELRRRAEAAEARAAALEATPAPQRRWWAPWRRRGAGS